LEFGEFKIGVPPSWERTAPTPYAEASVCRYNTFLKSSCYKMGLAHIWALRVLNAHCWGSS